MRPRVPNERLRTHLPLVPSDQRMFDTLGSNFRTALSGVVDEQLPADMETIQRGALPSQMSNVAVELTGQNTADTLLA